MTDWLMHSYSSDVNAMVERGMYLQSMQGIGLKILPWSGSAQCA